jgi:hypothetical protein
MRQLFLADVFLGIASRRQFFLSASSIFTGSLMNKYCFVCFIFTGLFTVRNTFFG